jgi:hypothetical protein
MGCPACLARFKKAAVTAAKWVARPTTPPTSATTSNTEPAVNKEPVYYRQRKK